MFKSFENVSIMMQVKYKPSIVLFFILSFFLAPAYSAMALPVLGANHETKECAEFFTGDECVYCDLPNGWENLGDFMDATCPEGYALLESFSVNSVCTPAKTEFCCTINHSGAGGDCEDVVVNHAGQKCAFVEDIENCPALPNGWQRAEIDPGWGRVCPSYEYKWLPSQEYPNDVVGEFLACESAGNGNGGQAGNGNQGGLANEGINSLVLYALIVMFFTAIALFVFKKIRKG